MSRRCIQVTVRGLVQGVGFRAWVQRQAMNLALCGWVRNAADGSVQVRIEGDPPKVEQLLQLLRSGPPGAAVSELLLQEQSGGEQLTEFFIRR